MFALLKLALAVGAFVLALGTAFGFALALLHVIRYDGTAWRPTAAKTTHE